MRNIKINCFKALKSPTSSPASLDLRLFLKNRSWLSHQSKAMKMVISVSTRLHLVFNFGMEAMKIETLVVHVCKSPFLATSTRTPSKIMCLCWKTMKMLIDDDQEMKTMSVLDLYFWENVMET
ncbi:hypothetical protein QVD17_36055 [Tagetes erecta]|uniref:Uncharacterized protein n=1 Tax=Tagetes erecta TaxID=13708 RepID=A0AAD8JU13_TARER|nr:hypothetical protein QVD17_36055 [Tagetes erecta]